MKITFLGTSHGIPAADRYCSCAMIEVNGSLYFIDAGAPVVDLVLRYGKHPNDIKAVFCTHHHGDHTDGLLNLTDLCNWAYKEASFDIFLTADDVAKAFIKAVEVVEAPCANGFDTARMRYHTVSEGTVFEDENVRITYFRTRHCEPLPSYAILVEADGQKAFFTGDMSQWLAKNDFPIYAIENETDIVVCEMAHFTPEQVTPYIERLKTGLLCFNHVFPLDKFEAIKAMNESGRFPFPVIAAKDGDVFEL